MREFGDLLVPDGKWTLEATRDALTGASADPFVEQAVMSIVDRARSDTSTTTISDLGRLLDELREVPEGPLRLRQINTLVRTLGQPEMLATVVDALRNAIDAPDEEERARAYESVTHRRHASYGWNGMTMLATSTKESTGGTSQPKTTNLKERFGGYPLPWWMLMVRVWQPNDAAEAFPSGKTAEPDLVMEPPHTHPFNFISMVVKGEMRQSMYEVTGGPQPSVGRYAGVPLEYVDHMWPPHNDRSTRYLSTIEDRVELRRGDSYFIPSELIHDLEVDREHSRTHPAVTLFLATEAVNMPYSFISTTMANFHANNLDLERRFTPLSEDQWSAKLRAVARYLRDESSQLELEPIVKHQHSYAFFHL